MKFALHTYIIIPSFPTPTPPSDWLLSAGVSDCLTKAETTHVNGRGYHEFLRGGGNDHEAEFMAPSFSKYSLLYQQVINKVMIMSGIDSDFN